jgi:excisionase family DNA binding protein
MNTTYLTIPETAREMRVCRATVYNMIAAKELRPINIGHGSKTKMRITRAELERFAAAKAMAA